MSLDREATYPMFDDDAESDCESIDMGTALRTALNEAKLLKRRLGMRRQQSLKQMRTEEVDSPVIAWFRHPQRSRDHALLRESLSYHPELDRSTISAPKKLGRRASNDIWHRERIAGMDESIRREVAAITA